MKNSASSVSFTDGPLWKLLIRFAVPLALTSIIQQLFHSADTAVLGHYVGADAMAAVGCSGPLVSLLLEYFIGLSNGANVVIARNIGAGDRARANDAVHTAVLTGLGGGFLLGIVGIFLCRPLLGLMSVPDAIFEDAVLYLKIYFAGMPFFLLNQFLSAVFRSKGDAKTPLYCLTGAGAVNVLLNLLFVLAFDGGIAGVAWATFVSTGVGTFLLFFLLMREEETVRFSFSRLRSDRGIFVHMVKIGIPSGFLGSVFSVSNVCVQSAINSLGTEVVSASSAAAGLEVYIQFFGNAFASAATTAVSQNYGAGQLPRCRAVIRTAIGVCEIATVTLSAVVFLFGRTFLLLFLTDAAIIEIAMKRMRYTVLFKFVGAVMDITNGCLQGFGYTLVPALISIFGVCGVRLLWIYAVFPAHHTLDGLMSVYPLTQGFAAVVQLCLCFLYVRKREKEKAAG